MKNLIEANVWNTYNKHFGQCIQLTLFILLRFYQGFSKLGEAIPPSPLDNFWWCGDALIIKLVDNVDNAYVIRHNFGMTSLFWMQSNDDNIII